MMTVRSFIVFAVVATAVVMGTSVGREVHDKHNEDLLLQMLPDGLLNAVFVFNTTGSSQTAHHTALPHVVADIMRVYGVQGLKVSLTHGRWRTDAWGYAPFSTEAPVGAELAFELQPESVTSGGGVRGTLAERIEGVRRAVSTLLCSSIDAMGDGAASGNETHYRGYLPLEAVCTENLAPWIQLLPCRDRAGIGALFNPLRLYGLPYHSMALSISQTPSGFLTVVQTLALVARRDRTRFQLSEIFAVAHGPSRTSDIALSACPVARHSRVTVALPPGASPELVLPKADDLDDPSRRTVLPNDVGVQYSLLPRGSCEKCDSDGLEITFDADKLTSSAEEARKGRAGAPLVSAHRFLTGYGQVSGGLILEVRSNAKTTPVDVRVTQELPCYIRPYFASLHSTINGKVVGNDTVATSVWYRESVGSQHARMDAAMTTETRLEPGAVLRVELYFEMVLLPLTEQPPEAERGRDLPAAVIDVVALDCMETRAALGPFVPSRTVNLPDGKHGIAHTQYTEGILVMTPWPDFSMPYNVVCMTLTIFGLFFGWIVVKLIRHLSEFYVKTTGEFRPAKSPLRRIIETIIGRPIAAISKLLKKKQQPHQEQEKQD